MKITTFLPVILCLALSLCNTTTTKAQSLYFHLYNNTNATISKVYVSPSESGSWNNNVIRGRYLYDESQVTVYVPNYYGATCYFDVKIVATNGAKWEFNRVDICNLFRLTVNWNNTYHTEWASY